MVSTIESWIWCRIQMVRNRIGIFFSPKSASVCWNYQTGKKLFRRVASVSHFFHFERQVWRPEFRLPSYKTQESGTKYTPTIMRTIPFILPILRVSYISMFIAWLSKKKEKKKRKRKYYSEFQLNVPLRQVIKNFTLWCKLWKSRTRDAKNTKPAKVIFHIKLSVFFFQSFVCNRSLVVINFGSKIFQGSG